MNKYKVTKQLSFCAAHRLYNYNGKCSNLHGHNWNVFVTISSKDLDNQGMILDFGIIQKIVKQWIDENLDHKTIIYKDDPLKKKLEELGIAVYSFPVNPTAEHFASFLSIKIQALLEAFSVTVENVRIYENASSFAEWGN